jgi:hypothetical protein
MTTSTSDEALAGDAREVLLLLCAVEHAGYHPIEIHVGDVRVVMQPAPPKPLPGGAPAAKTEPGDIYDEFGADDPEYQALKTRHDAEE